MCLKYGGDIYKCAACGSTWSKRYRHRDMGVGTKKKVCARCGEVREHEDLTYHSLWCHCDLDEDCDHGLCDDCLCEVLDGDG